MILDTRITGTHIELLHENKARKKAVEKVPVQARHRSDSAFPARLALMDEQPESSDMSLLMNLYRSILQALSEDQFVYTRNRHGAALSLPGASEIGESLDDGIHSRFLYPETLKKTVPGILRSSAAIGQPVKIPKPDQSAPGQ
ncbi:hypothetical protein [Faecalibaculum rodentium]|jgi:hypothetical protein|uniref:hypothetical protein n=1 Tax=Faecalibaculum rodentium TaxID=1702221 RepID=UPI0023F49BF9|nr:hypothetical protein [Faecalibaculum rodentium]